MSNETGIIKKVCCNKCKLGKESNLTIDLLCDVRKIFLNPGKGRRCGYYIPKILKRRVIR